MDNNKQIVVSNRLPLSVERVNGRLVFSASSGGLATAMSSINNVLWIGWPGIASDNLTTNEKNQIIKEFKLHNYYPVFLTQKQIDLYYQGYANDTIWPLFHYFQSLAKYDDKLWQAYSHVNNAFCDTIKQLATANSRIWIQDYHLMLLPNLIREALPKSTIGFFLHIPFPSYEIFRLLPNRKDLLAGVLGADLIGFQTYDYARHFLSSVQRLLGVGSEFGVLEVGDRAVKVDVFTIGINYQKIVDQLKSSDVLKELAVLNLRYEGTKTILSMDRLDYSKGIAKKLEAYDLFLKLNPKFIKRVSLIVIAVPSRTNVLAYKKLRREIEQAISRINGLYSTIDWTPISYQFKNLPPEQIVALQTYADIALITPLRDGMNLVAKEYVASKQNQSGVLILSEIAGAANELTEALLVNPNDKLMIANAIKQALAMPKKQQKERLLAMQNRLINYDIKHWAADFLKQLSEVKKYQTKRSLKLLDSHTRNKIIDDFKNSKKRILFLDYDGTLRSFVNSPDAKKAAPSPELLKMLRDISSKPNTKVCIVSGRTRQALDLWFNNMRLTLIAEHGAWIKHSKKWKKESVSFTKEKANLLPILQNYAERTPGAIIEEKSCALVWHYRNVPAELAYIRNVDLQRTLYKNIKNTCTGVFLGNKIIEIKPKNIHKGNVVARLLLDNPSDFVLAIGDDYTDESMFESLPNYASTIKVGIDNTSAKFQVKSVESVHNLLCDLGKSN